MTTTAGAPAPRNGNSVRDKLQNRAAGTGNLPAAQPKTLAEQINALIPQFQRAAPKHLNPERLARIALTEVKRNPQLGLCTPSSFFGALMLAAQLGLEPGPTGQAYLVPYRNKGQLEVQYITGYKGMLDLVRRSGETIGVPKARIVYVNDLFNLEYGFEEKFTHVPWYARKDQEFKEPGEKLGAYCYVAYKSGGSDVFFMPKFEILKHRDRSAAKSSGPWVTDEEAMWKKTVIRANFAYLPVSIEYRDLVTEGDERVALATIKEDSIDVDFSEVNPETGETGITAQEAAEAALQTEGKPAQTEGDDGFPVGDPPK